MTESNANVSQQFSFEAEVDQLLDIVVHSLYSHREVFVRELISNASDALDKLRFRALTEPGLGEGGATLEIRIRADKDAGTLTFEDTGIGMSREELIRNLGTIAHSGTKAFLASLRETKADAKLIGQFGVGFYSAFLVADKVVVESRGAGSDEAWRWTSAARKGYTIEPCSRAERGTSITLHLGADHKNFLEPWTLTNLVTKYSDYVQHPIRVATLESDGTLSWKTQNQAKALWLRPKSEISAEEYSEFYSHISHDFSPPLTHAHFQVEGNQSAIGLLYVPSRPPFDLMMPDRQRGVRLYVKRVFVMDQCEELVPPWLRFVKGVIDSDDLPLNVSREILQDSSVTRVLRKQVIRRTLDALSTLATEDSEKYNQFWSNFGAVLKEGLSADADATDKLKPLLRWESSADLGLVSLQQYRERMKPEQAAIYYMVGRNKDTIRSSPHLESLLAQGFEVLYFTDPVDEWAVQALPEFDGKPLQSALDANLSLAAPGDDAAPATADADRLVEVFKRILADRVKDVRTSRRLTESPACLVVPQGGMSAQMESIVRLYNRDLPTTKRIFEFQPEHPLVRRVAALSLAGDAAEAELVDWVELLYDQALLTEGSGLDNPNAFARRLTRVLQSKAETTSE
jgi:molecular chaperone HtpG